MSLKKRWVEIERFPNYQASNRGDIQNRNTGKILKQANTSTGGYHHVRLCNEAGCFTQRVHRLVASCFMGPPPPGTEVNHKDGDKSNNTPENFEYISHRQNMQHAYTVLGFDPNANRKIRVRLVELDKVFDSISDAARFIGVRQSVVSNVISGPGKSVHGYHFEVVKE